MIEAILSRPGRFLIIGDCFKEFTVLEQAGWKGLVFFPERKFTGPLSDDLFYSESKFFSVAFSQDSHFVRTMDGYWVKGVSPVDIFDQFGGEKFDLILIDVPMMTRLLWESPPVQVHMPRYHMLRDDGHNTGTRKQAAELGYSVIEDGKDWLVFAR